MPLKSYLFTEDPGWFASPLDVRFAIPSAAKSWLYESSSLTGRLRDDCGVDFRVTVFDQSWKKPFLSESRTLCLGTGRFALVREVRLSCGQRPLILARTIIPGKTLKGVNRRLACLGTRPLGEFIFTYPRLRRLVTEITLVEVSQWTDEMAQIGAIEEKIWGRRTLYGIGGRNLLVCEFFLPNVYKLKSDEYS